jgi:hypothetical protein
MRSTYLYIFLLFFLSCREEYMPDIKPTDLSVLVVEGFINVDGESKIRLSKSKNLSDTSIYEPVLNAAVLIESDAQESFPMLGTSSGEYISFNNQLNAERKYRIKIAVEGKQYESEFVDPLLTPPIEEVGWKQENGIVKIDVTTRSENEDLRYYLWNYTETWEIQSKYEALYKYNGEFVEPRNSQEVREMFQCWNNEESSRILTTSSTNNQTNVVANFPILEIVPPDQKLSVRYSVLVRQFSIPRKAFDFYELIKKNTESTGSIFGPLPAEVSGNIRCITNPRELVIGFISAATQQEKRIFISRHEVNWNFNYRCDEIYVPNHPDSMRLFYTVYTPYQMKGFNEGYFSAGNDCMDCRLYGSSRRPTFW